MAVTYRRYYQEREDLLTVKVCDNVVLILPNEVSNRKGASVFLRSLYEADSGKPLLSFPEISECLGYQDRQASNNFWREFGQSDYEFQAFMERRRKVSNSEVVGFMQHAWSHDVGLTLGEMRTAVEERFGIQASEASIREASKCVEVWPILKAVHRQLEQGQQQYKESWLLEQMFEHILGGVEGQAGQSLDFDWSAYRQHQLCPCSEADQNSAGQRDVTESASVPASARAGQTENVLLQQDLPEDEKEQVWDSSLAVSLWLCLLSFNGVSLERLGQWFGMHKTTVYRRIMKIVGMNLGWLPDVAHSVFSGVANIDELYLKIGGVCYYLFVAIDPNTSYVLHWALLPSNGFFYCLWFLVGLRLKGFSPKAIVTDGLAGYVLAIPLCFGLRCKHQRCVFHVLRNACKKLKQQVTDPQLRAALRDQLLKLFRAKDKRTVIARMERLKQKLEQEGLGGIACYLLQRLPKLLHAVGSRCIPRTGNAVERLFRNFRHFQVRKYGFHSFETAQRQIDLFMLGYTLDLLFKKVKQNPAEGSQHLLSRTLLYNMWTEPRVSMLMNQTDPSEFFQEVEQLKYA